VDLTNVLGDHALDGFWVRLLRGHNPRSWPYWVALRTECRNGHWDQTCDAIPGVHPTQEGQRAIADAINSAIGSQLLQWELELAVP
jgi:hypothetical protein